MRARKRFGQHFLDDGAVLERIASAVAIKSGENVVEIGPGHGALTEHLFDDASDYWAIEIDRDLTPLLQARYPDMHIINDDVLRIDFAGALPAGRWRVVGNLPYNISSPLIVRIIEHIRNGASGVAFTDMHFMLQKEMAERLAASPGSKSWGRLSVLAQIVLSVEYLFDVFPESFSPPPRVMSGVVRMMPAPVIPDIDWLALDRLLKGAFGGRRKRLSNSLRDFDIEWERTSVDPGVRADDVSKDQFLELLALSKTGDGKQP